MVRKKTIRLGFVLLCVGLLFMPVGVSAESGIQIIKNSSEINFPESISFQVEINHGVEISRVVLEYYTDQLTCGSVFSKAFPSFTPAKNVGTEWTWEMRQSGSLPTGIKILWRWRITDVNGIELLTPEQSVIWIDSIHAWQVLTEGNINLHWYDAGQYFSSQLLGAATRALVTLDEKIGLVNSSLIDLYIYTNNQDFQDAILYEPGWAGGLAFPAQNIVLIGISPDNLEWGKDTIAHELTHVLEGHFTFSCLGDMPTWLVEGIAVYGEGGLDPSSQSLFDRAVQENDLLPVKAISGGFSEDPDKADLSYSESYSLVNFLVEQYGKEKLLELMTQLRDGVVIENALQTIYGFGLDGFESVWQQNIGAAGQLVVQQSTPTALPTPVPTIVPVSGFSVSSEVATNDVLAPTNTAAPYTTSNVIEIPLFVVILISVILTVTIVLIVILVRRRKISHE